MTEGDLNLKKYSAIIEDAIQLLGINPVTARGNEFGTWIFRRGSAKIELFMRRSKSHAGERDVLVVASELMLEPRNDKETFYTDLLRLNHKFVSEKLSVHDGVVYLSSARFAQGMDSGEVVAMLDSLSFIADTLDDQLIEKYS